MRGPNSWFDSHHRCTSVREHKKCLGVKIRTNPAQIAERIHSRLSAGKRETPYLTMLVQRLERERLFPDTGVYLNRVNIFTSLCSSNIRG